MEPYEYKEAIKVMESRGYAHTADNHAKNVLFFLKKFDDKKLHLHATVTLATHLIDLDTVGNLSLGVTLYCDSIDIENIKFEDFEKKLLNYLYLCAYGEKHCDSIQEPGRSSDDRMVEPDGSEKQGKTSGGGKSTGGVEKGKGKPSKPIKERKNEFWEEVRGVAKQKGYPKELALEFYRYWTEDNKSGTRFRKEAETYFDIPRRFATWIGNDKRWSKETFIEKKIEKQDEKLKEKKQNLKHKDLF